MAVTYVWIRERPLHPLHAFLLAAAVPLFLGALLCDLAYMSSYHIQWGNFSSWLIAGGLVFSGLALLWALIELLRMSRAALAYFLMLLATWVLGFLNALMHARDAWATMPGGMILSAIVLVLAIVATVMGFSGFRAGGTR